MKETIVSGGQSPLDIAIQETGRAEGVFDLAQLNGWADITTDLAAGQKLKLPAIVADARQVAEYFSTRKIRVNTGANTLTTYDRIFDETFDETFN